MRRKKIIILSCAALFAAICVIGLAVSPVAEERLNSAAPPEGRYVVLDDSTFESFTAGKLVFVDFWADWCGPCHAFAPLFAAASLEVTEGIFAKVDIESEDASGNATSALVWERYSKGYIPLVLALVDGKEVAECGGADKANFTQWCRDQIAKHGK